eukprot:405157-Heterocapsa_arctica.AAC.1
MRNAVNTLRRRSSLFSHSVIHDAILIANRIPANEVTEAIVQANVELNMKGVQVNVKCLKAEQQAAKEDSMAVGFRNHNANKQPTGLAFSHNQARTIEAAKQTIKQEANTPPIIIKSRKGRPNSVTNPTSIELI